MRFFSEVNKNMVLNFLEQKCIFEWYNISNFYCCIQKYLSRKCNILKMYYKVPWPFR